MNTFISIVIAVVAFGLIILIHELGHFICARISGVRVNEFAIGMGPRLFKFGKGETVFSLRAIPIGGFVSMEGEDEESDGEGSLSKAPIANRILIVVAGAVMNLILGFIMVVIVVSSGDSIRTSVIGGFHENSISAQQVDENGRVIREGFVVGDEIFSVNGRKVYVSSDVSYELVRSKDWTADFVVIRDGEKIKLEDHKLGTYFDENNREWLDFSIRAIDKTLPNVIKESFNETISIIRLVFVSLVDLITGNVPVSELSGPVGIVGIIGDAFEVSFISVVNIVAFISINIGVFNLLPLPALDGGRLIFLLIEAVTKKKVSTKVEAIVHLAGFVLLIGLMLFVTYNDITKLFTK